MSTSSKLKRFCGCVQTWANTAFLDQNNLILQILKHGVPKKRHGRTQISRPYLLHHLRVLSVPRTLQQDANGPPQNILRPLDPPAATFWCMFHAVIICNRCRLQQYHWGNAPNMENSRGKIIKNSCAGHSK